MALLTVIMKHGFADDRVVVRVNGRVVFDREHLHLRREIDRAAAFDHEVSSGTADVEIEVRSRGLAERRRIDLGGPKTLIVSIRAGRLELGEHDGLIGDA